MTQNRSHAVGSRGSPQVPLTNSPLSLANFLPTSIVPSPAYTTSPHSHNLNAKGRNISFVTSRNEPTSRSNIEMTRKGLSQLDGPPASGYRTDFTFTPPAMQRQRAVRNQTSTTPRAPTVPQSAAPPNAVMDLLPWGTTHMHLSQDQVIALSDVAGSLKEVVLLALSAAVDEGAKEHLERAVGVEAAAGIVDFWVDEWVAD